MFTQDKAEVDGRVDGVEEGVAYFGKLVFESDE